MNRKLIISLIILTIIILFSGCVGNVPVTNVDEITSYKLLKIDGQRIYYYDDNNNIGRIDTTSVYVYFIESNKTILEYQKYNVWNRQWVLYINISK